MPGRAQRRDAHHPAQQAQVQYRADLALSAVAPLSRCLRRDWIAGARGNSRLAAYRRRTVEADIDRQREPHDSPRLEPSVHHSVGRAHQRVERRSRLLRSHQCAGPQAGPDASDRRHSLLSGIGISRRCFHHERLRFSAEAAQSPALSEHRVRRAHLSHQDHRPGGTAHRAHDAPRPHPRPAGLESAICRRHWLVRLRLQHARRFWLRRSHLLSRRHRHVPRAQTGGWLLQVAVRPRGRGCARAGIPLGAGRCFHRILEGGHVLQLRPHKALHRGRTGGGSGS